MTLAVAEALTPNKPNQTVAVIVAARVIGGEVIGRVLVGSLRGPPLDPTGGGGRRFFN